MTTRAVRRRLALAALACCTAAASGCGSSELTPELHPGSAAVVGDERISLDEADDFADGICEWQLGLKEPEPAVPMAFVRAVSVNYLVQAEAHEQYAAEHGLEPDRIPEQIAVGSGVTSTSLREYLALVEESVHAQMAEGKTTPDEAIEYRQGQYRFLATALAAGLADDPTLDETAAVERGQELIEAWKEDNGVEIDPRFGTNSSTPEGLGFTPPDELSVPASGKLEAAAYFDNEYLEELPDSQRCGTSPSTTS